MVRTFLKVYMELGSFFLFLQEQIKDIIIKDRHSSHPYLILSASSGCMQKMDSECLRPASSLSLRPASSLTSSHLCMSFSSRDRPCSPSDGTDMFKASASASASARLASVPLTSERRRLLTTSVGKSKTEQICSGQPLNDPVPPWPAFVPFTSQ